MEKKKYLRIDSMKNSSFKAWKSLMKKKYRDKDNLFLVEGMHLVEEAHKTGDLKEIILLETEMKPEMDVPIFLVTERIMQELTHLICRPKIIGVCKKSKERKDLGKKMILLDNVRDPGNLGTIIRSSVAFGLDTIVLGDYCCDLYNPKVISATQGMMFNMNVVHMDTDVAIKKIKEAKIKLYATDVKKGKDLKRVKPEDSFCFIVGNEGAGLAEDTKAKCDDSIHIKMERTTESLNVAVASSIIIYQLTK